MAGGSCGNGGDGGAAIATSAQLNNPYGIAADDHETIYIADKNNNKIRKVTHAGIITTFAGTGSWGSSGDGSAAISGQLNQPQGVAVDITSGSVYIADTGNGRIRVVNHNGIISTFAGSYSYSSYNSYDCAATSAQLVSPGAVAVDHLGNVYIGTGNQYSSNGNQVLYIAHGTSYITALAGCSSCYTNGYSGSATNVRLNPVTGIAVDVNLNVYIATSTQYQSNNQVLIVTHSTGIIAIFAGSNNPTNGDGGPASSAQLRSPSGIGVDFNGNVYITDQQNNNVRLVSNGTGIITTYAGGGYGYGGLGDNGPATNAYLNYPNGLLVDAKGNVLISDTYDCRIRKVISSMTYPTSQPSVQPSMPSSQPSLQPTGMPSIFVWHPKYKVSICWLSLYDVDVLPFVDNSCV